MKKEKIQLIEQVVPVANASVRISEDLDKGYEKVTGISFLDTIGLNNILKDSSIDGKELFPKDFEVLFLQSNVFVPPDRRFFTVQDHVAKGTKFEMDFQDGGTAFSYPYTLKIYVRLENEC